MRILSPFAGKFKYNKNYFPDGVYKSPRLLLANINWHYDVSSDYEYEYCIKNYNNLLKQDFDLFNKKSECVVENQPYWDLQKNETFEYDYSGEDKVTNENCFGKNIELLAWYESAHFHQCDDYGIHLIPVGIVHTADILINNCKKYNLIISKRMAVVWAMNILYCHELVHSWIEDIASLIEFSSGKDIYGKTQKKFNCYIFMEEAICNTAVYGLQLSFLDRSGKKQFEVGRRHQAENDNKKYIKDIHSGFNKNIMMKALYDFMKTQPKGYRDFIEIDTNPNESFIFVRELIYLFKRVYQCDYRTENELYEAMDLYFGLSMYRARYSKKIEVDDIDFTRQGYYETINWSNETPIRFHI